MNDDRAPSNETSLTLLQRVKQSNPQAWERLVGLYNPLLFYWASVCGLQGESAADMVQEVWKSVATSILNFEKSDEKSTFRGWLWTISRNKARDSHRRHAKQFHATGGTDSLRLLESIQETEPIDSDDSPGRELVRRALELIRPEFETHTWNAFERMVLDGWSAAHTASELKMKPNAVHQARFRILRRLRLELSGLEDLRIYAD